MRLAERRQLLYGIKASPVQEFALHLLMVADARDKSKERLEAFKMAMISFDPAHYLPIMFPEWKTAADKDKVRVEATEEDLADTRGEWEFTEKITEEEAAEIMAQMLENPIGTVTTKSSPNGGWM